MVGNDVIAVSVSSGDPTRSKSTVHNSNTSASVFVVVCQLSVLGGGD